MSAVQVAHQIGSTPPPGFRAHTAPRAEVTVLVVPHLHRSPRPVVVAGGTR
mgnify:CR=1 FL=1